MYKLFFSSLFLCSFYINVSAQPPQRQLQVTNFNVLNQISADTIKYTFQVQELPNQTYGYVIYANDMPYLRQLNAPGKSANMGFGSKESAQKAAKVIIYKLEHPTVPPTLSTLEMQYLGID